MGIESPKSPVIPIFLVIFFLGFLLSAAGGTYLYFKWETHFPPIADLQDQVRSTRATSEAEKEAEKEIKRTGVPKWTEELSDQYTNRANEMGDRMERDLAKAQASAEAAEHGEDHSHPEAAKPKHNNLAAIQRALAEQRSSAETGAALAETVTEVEEEVTPLKSGGTIEKMDNDWLPPGVTKSE